MAIKTREKLIEVARQLFARKGVENTTMLDIANASDKGRRTIYTYFRNKREIHQAVIERESEQIVMRQRQILDSALSPVAKLRDFMEARLRIVTCPTGRQLPENVANILRLDFKRAEKTRRLAARKEVEILNQILREGVAAGQFDASQAQRAAAVVVLLMQGFDHPNSDTNLEFLGIDRDAAESGAVDFVMDALLSGPKQQNNNN